MPRGANRTDTLVPTVNPQPPGQPNGQAPAQPITVPTGLPYGENQALQQAQHAAPLPAPPGAMHPQPVGVGQAMQAAKNFQMPALGELTGPTERPNEPVTAGLPQGAGPGAQTQSQGIGSMLARMSQAVNSPALAQLAARANSLQQ